MAWGVAFYCGDGQFSLAHYQSFSLILWLAFAVMHRSRRVIALLLSMYSCEHKPKSEKWGDLGEAS